MTKSILVSTGTAMAVPAGTVRYCPTAITNVSQRGTEAGLSQIVYRTAGTFSKLFVHVTANATSASSTVRLRIDGVNGNQSLTIGAGLTGIFEDAVNTDVITTGQKVGYQITVGAGGTLTINVMSVIFLPTNTDETVSRLATDHQGGLAIATASSTQYTQLVSQLQSPTITEANAQTHIQTAGTLRNLEVYVRDNTRTTSTTVRTRKNGANGNQLITIGAGATGLFEDTSNTDSIASGDNANFEIITGTGVGTLTMEHIAVDFVTANGIAFSSYGFTGGFTQTEPVTTFPIIGGDAKVASVATEAQCQVKTRIPCEFNKMTVLVTANTITDTTTLKFRKNGADGNQVINIGASATGVFTDTTNVDVCDADDLVNYQLVTPAVDGTPSITLRHISTNIDTTTLFERSINEPTFEVAAAVVRDASFMRTVPAELEVIGAAARMYFSNRVVNDSLTIADGDAITLAVKLSRAISETVTIIEDVTAIKKFTRSISENISIDDVVDRLIRNIKAALASLAITTQATGYNLHVTVTESLEITAGVTAAIIETFARSVSDSLTVTVSAVRKSCRFLPFLRNT